MEDETNNLTQRQTFMARKIFVRGFAQVGKSGPGDKLTQDEYKREAEIGMLIISLKTILT